MRSLTLLRKFRKKSFTTSDATTCGVSAGSLAYLIKNKKIKRLIHGLYAFYDYYPTSLEENIADYFKLFPQAIVGYETALQLYNLTEELVEDIFLIVPTTNVPKRQIKDVEFYQVGLNFNKIKSKKVRGLPTTTINQTIVDLLRYDKPLSTVIDIFYQARGRKDLDLSISKIKKIAKIFRTTVKTDIFLEAIS